MENNGCLKRKKIWGESRWPAEKFNVNQRTSCYGIALYATPNQATVEKLGGVNDLFPTFYFQWFLLISELHLHVDTNYKYVINIHDLHIRSLTC